jgi:DNA ligase 1
MPFESLYKLNKNGKIKKWDIVVTDFITSSKINITTGLLQGKQTHFEIVIQKGKNIGKKSETSPYSQAMSEAKSKWNKKIVEGYTVNATHPAPLSEGARVVSAVSPMLALDYTTAGHKIVFPSFCQPKIDGLRAIFQNKQFHSRLKNTFLHLESLIEELQDCPFILDGELFTSKSDSAIKTTKRTKIDPRDALTFQELSGIVRKKHDLTDAEKTKIENVIYIVYDIVDTRTPFRERHTILNNYFKGKNFKKIELLKTETCGAKEEVGLFLNKYIKEGHEGLILRNKEGLYTPNYRSSDLQKYKKFKDAEFKIVGFTEGSSSTEKGCIIWICETKDLKRFSVRPKGSFAERKKLFKKGNKYIGMELTVKFFDYTDDGVPFHTTTLYGGEADIRSLHA